MAQFPNGARNYAVAFGTSSSISAIIQTRAPASTDTHGPNGIFPVGQPWIDTSADIIYGLTSLSTSGGVVSANWVSLGSSTSGDIATLTGDSGGAISPVSANIDLLGTASEIETAGTAGTITFSLSSTLVAPGSLEVTGLLTGDASATIDTAGTTLSLGTDASADSILIGTSGARAINIGSAASAALSIDAGTTLSLSSADTGPGSITIEATDAAGGISMDAGSTGILIGTSSTCTPIRIGESAPSVNRTITVGQGTVTDAVADVIDIGPNGVSTDAGAAKTVNIANGSTLLGTTTVNIGTGTAATGACNVNISTGTGGGTKNVVIGNADALTTIDSRGITLINSSVDANVSICTGTSTGATAIGNSVAGAFTADTAANISLQAATASDFTCSLASSAAAITISASAADSGITLDAGATPGITFTNGTQSHQMLVGTGSPNGSVTASQGSLYVDVGGSSSTTILFCNTDGGTTWLGVGA